jgi:hypothetical protein
MNNSADRIRGLNLKYGLGAVIALFVIGAVSLWLIFTQDAEQKLMPLLPSPTPPIYLSQQEPETVAFTELNDNPLAFLNRSILVTGDYLPLEKSDCLNVVGPDKRWSLAADNLQLDVLGFEKIVRLLPVGTNMTVQGIWRLYQGPLGCGKGPPRGSMWYLDAKKIIQPNPLISEGSQAIPVEIINGTLELPSLEMTVRATETGPAANVMTVTAMAESTIIATPTFSGQLIPTETPPLPGEITPTATSLQPPTTVGLTNTPDPNATMPVATGNATAVPTSDPGNNPPTLTPDTPLLPATATETSGGYLGPEGTATWTPTATPDPYS